MTTDIIDRAAEAAFGSFNPEGTKKGRIRRLLVLQGEFVRDLAPNMARNDALTLGCLFVDMGLAVHHGRKFLPGNIRRTPGLDGLSNETALALVNRHVRGDWGDLSDEDREANEVALQGGGRLLSCYRDVRDGDFFWVKVWVLTDADVAQRDGAVNRLRLSTTLMLPSEY